MNQRGYTLVELLLSVTLLTVIAGVSVPISYTFVTKNNLSVSESASVHAMRRAATLSSASEGNTTWGFYIQAGSITVFQGASYAVRDSTYDEITTIGNDITPSGLTEVVFSRPDGFPTSTGTLTLTTSSGLSETVVINAYGGLTY